MGSNPGRILYTANSASTFGGFSPDGATVMVMFDRPQLVTLRGTNPGNIIYTANSTSVFGGFSFDGATAAVLFDRPQLVFTRGANPGRIIYTANSVSTFGGFSPDGDTACILFDRPQLVNTREPNPGQIIYTANSTSAFSGFSLDSDTAVVLFDRPQLVNTRSPNPGQIVYTANSTSTFSSFSFDRTRGTGLGAISTCDIDGDGSTDVNDLQTLALRILSGSGGADLNNDGITNIQDLQLLANVILRIITCPGDTTTTTSTSTTIRTTTTTSTTTSSTTTTRTTTSTTTTRATTSTTTTTTLPLQCNLFNYNFSSGNIAEWAVEGGTWQILGGQFQVSNITNNPALALYRRDLPFPALFRMEMDITVQTNETNPSLWVGGFEPYSDRGQIFNFQLAGGGTLTIDGIGAIRLADGRAAFFTYHPDSTGGYAEGFYSFGAANYGQVNRLGIQWASDSICIIINGAIPNQGCYPPALLGLTSIPPPGLNKLALAASGATTTTRFANICEGDPFYALSVPENAGNLINEPVIVTPIAPAMLKPARKEQ
jgi:hypothetical protein